MLTRLALPEDEEAVVALSRICAEETVPHLGFDPEAVRKTFRNAVTKAMPTLFVAEERRQVVGLAMCFNVDYAFTTGCFVILEILYVKPDRRGSRAAAGLVSRFMEWGDILGAKECIVGTSNGFQSDRTARFFEHFGAKRFGFYLKRIR